MYHVKFVNEEFKTAYNGQDCLEEKIHYVMDYDKVNKDKYRVNLSRNICSGCSPYPFTLELEHDPDMVALLMKTNNICWGKDFNDVLRHRIVSFPSSELALPDDVDNLGRMIINYYSRNGFIACYGVHRNTYNYHIHILVNTTAYLTGIRFNIYNEFRFVHEIIKEWEKMYMETKLDSPEIIEKYNNLLFGDDYLKPSQVALGSREQIRTYKQLYDRAHI